MILGPLESGPRRVRVWIDELPHTIVANEILNVSLPGSPSSELRETSIAVEMSVFVSPSFMYAMLGARFRPLPSDSLRISISINDGQEDRFSESIAWHGDRVSWGLPGCYAKAVLKTAQNFNAEIPSGTFDFVCAAHAEVASNEIMFACLTQTLLMALSDRPAPYTIARTALQQNLNKNFAFLA